MSIKHPIIAVTGSSGAGTTTVKQSFEHIFLREKIAAAVIEGDSMHKYDRAGMKRIIVEMEDAGARPPTHFGPNANLLSELSGMFRVYGETGYCKRRFYLHSEEEAAPYGQTPGTFTPWEEIPEHTDLLFYEGLHGAHVGDDADVAQHVDLAIGVVPVVNLEWIQKIHRDTEGRGYSAEAVTQTILRRMHDYVHFICPQFSRTHINFQRVPIVDTSNPFIARDIPTLDESLVVIRFRDYHGVDFPYLLNMIRDSFMSRPNSIVVPGGKMGLAMELVLSPIILEMMVKAKAVG
ncbi:MAG: phosphoribulokinase [Candidatus Nitricoxidivorans perseverans]|uniref:Phosphoribulokinase n=1 Tax=Candidatus Nitricoxidivorans perseverans TaxID=2975601 RepID=A0AA49J366_9PROT|nr:MAG: phosphoribulokinase [Candidatus Nitricoxidivorans perseverans]